MRKDSVYIFLLDLVKKSFEAKNGRLAKNAIPKIQFGAGESYTFHSTIAPIHNEEPGFTGPRLISNGSIFHALPPNDTDIVTLVRQAM